METFVDFLVNNYLWVLVISLVVVFALIGYLVDSVTPKKEKNKIKPIHQDFSSDVKVHPSVEAYTNEDFDDPLINEK